MYSFSTYSSDEILPDLTEGINDPAIFKAIFMAGGPGSGKSYIADQLGLKALGYRPVNIDNAFEMLAKKRNFNLKMSDKEMDKIEKIRNRAREITGKQLELALMGRLGLIIDGTGKDFEKIQKTKKQLEDSGYETMMVMVNTTLDVAKERNDKRARSVPDTVVKKSWSEVQDNIGKFQSLFGGSRMAIVDNSGGRPEVSSTYKTIMKFTQSPPRSKEAKKWIKQQKR